MKKMIAMILALVTVLSLCACGANTPAPDSGKPGASAEENVPDVTQPEEPKIPNLDMFVGNTRGGFGSPLCAQDAS